MSGTASASGAPNRVAAGTAGGVPAAANGGSNPPPRLILASSSPRRQMILREAGYEFTVQPADINEDNYSPGLMPSEVAKHLAVAKADAVVPKFPNDVVLAADTIVVFGDR